MEDYEKKYKQALERAKDLLHIKDVTNYGLDIDLLETIFPELKESEDEEIRKALIEMVHDTTGDELWVDYNVHKEDALAWLEKQGTPAKLSEEEQNSFAKGVLSNCALSFINYLDAHSYEGKMCVSNGECEDIDYAFHNAMWDKLHRYYCKYIEKQSEQKQEWSEEGERICQCLIKDQEESLDEVRNDKYGHSEIISDLKEMYRERINWLKSLKERIKGKED